MDRQIIVIMIPLKRSDVFRCSRSPRANSVAYHRLAIASDPDKSRWRTRVYEKLDSTRIYPGRCWRQYRLRNLDLDYLRTFFCHSLSGSQASPPLPRYLDSTHLQLRGRGGGAVLFPRRDIGANSRALHDGKTESSVQVLPDGRILRTVSRRGRLLDSFIRVRVVRRFHYG